uniref:Uncharacterized protein n=1 Tax=Geospiza parvula TaxID=87175 RepID=A0A8C3MH86_GEOPR
MIHEPDTKGQMSPAPVPHPHTSGSSSPTAADTVRAGSSMTHCTQEILCSSSGHQMGSKAPAPAFPSHFPPGWIHNTAVPALSSHRGFSACTTAPLRSLQGSEAECTKHTMQAGSSGMAVTKRHPRPLAELGPKLSTLQIVGLSSSGQLKMPCLNDHNHF